MVFVTFILGTEAIYVYSLENKNSKYCWIYQSRYVLRMKYAYMSTNWCIMSTNISYVKVTFGTISVDRFLIRSSVILEISTRWFLRNTNGNVSAYRIRDKSKYQDDLDHQDIPQFRHCRRDHRKDQSHHYIFGILLQNLLESLW